MSKRVSEFQLTQPGFSDGSATEDNEASGIEKADQQTMAKRKIVQLKRRIGPSGIKAPSPAPYSKGSNPFGSLVSAGAPSTLNQGANGAKPNDTKKAKSARLMRRRALNMAFAELLNKLKAEDRVYSDWSDTVNDYLKISRQLDEEKDKDESGNTNSGTITSGGTDSNGTKSNPFAFLASTSTSTSPSNLFSSNNTNSDTKTGSSGFTFTPKTSVDSGSGFKFGSFGQNSAQNSTQKPTEQSQNGAPSFTPSFSPNFSQKESQNESQKPKSASFFNSTVNEDKIKDKKDEDKDGGKVDEPLVPKPPKESSPFSFNTNPSATTVVPSIDSDGFKFAKAQEPTKNDESKDEPKEKSKETPKAPQTTNPFQFGQSTSPATGFTFGSASFPSAPANKDKENTTSTPAKPAFNPDLFKAKSAFADHTWSPEKGIKFESKPSSTAASSNTQSAFTSSPFGQPTTTGFKFGASVTPFSGFSATEPKDSSKEPSKEPSKESSNTNESSEPSKPDDTNEPSDEISAANQVNLSEKGSGEEKEDCLYEKKAKVYELVSGQYSVLGLGALRVLRHQETKKTRLLVRAEGSGRVLLNTLLKPEVKYTSEGKGQVKVVDVKPEGTLTTYMIRVKTEADGKELAETLESNKKA